MKISGVVFDFGGVITVNRIPIELKKYAAEIGIDWDCSKEALKSIALNTTADLFRSAKCMNVFLKTAQFP